MGTTWRTPSSTQTGRAGCWSSVRCSPSFCLVLSSWCVGVDALMGAVLWWIWPLSDIGFLTPPDLSAHGVGNSENVARDCLSCHDRLKFWLFSSAWRGLWPELLIKSFSSSSPSVSSSLLLPILCCCCCCLFSQEVCTALEKSKHASQVGVVCSAFRPLGKRMSPLWCFRRTCENLETAMVYPHRQLSVLLRVHHSKCLSRSVSHVGSLLMPCLNENAHNSFWYLFLY